MGIELNVERLKCLTDIGFTFMPDAAGCYQIYHGGVFLTVMEVEKLNSYPIETMIAYVLGDYWQMAYDDGVEYGEIDE